MPPRSKSSSYLSQYGTISHAPHHHSSSKLSKKNGSRDRSVDSLVPDAASNAESVQTSSNTNNRGMGLDRNNSRRYKLKSLSEEIIDNDNFIEMHEAEENGADYTEMENSITPVNSRRTPDVSSAASAHQAPGVAAGCQRSRPQLSSLDSLLDSTEAIQSHSGKRAFFGGSHEYVFSNYFMYLLFYHVIYEVTFLV